MREMKNSGVEWIGNIPSEWNLIRFKDKYQNLKEIAGSNSSKYERLALTMQGVIKRSKDDDNGLQPKEFSGYQILRKGDFIFKMIDLQNVSTSRVGLSDYTGLVSPAYIKFTPKENDNSNKFIYYFLMSMYYNKVFNSLGGDGVRSALNANDMANLRIPFPDLKTQDKIVSLVDNCTENINCLISNQEQQIEKLKQYKQSLITEVVTKGLNPDVPMKDSGVEWIGMISVIHNIYRLKYLLNSQMLYGANEAGSFYTNNAVRYIRITDITEDNKLKDSSENLYLSIEKAKPYILKDKDVLFARSGATVGKAFMYLNEYGKSAFAGYLIKAECNTQRLLPEYLFYYTQSSLYEYWKNMIFIQATIQNIGANKYSNMPIIQMSLDEQSQIVKFLDDKCAKIDRLITIKQEKIDKLNDYKKSLIYEYVTGKKEA